MVEGGKTWKDKTRTEKFRQNRTEQKQNSPHHRAQITEITIPVTAPPLEEFTYYRKKDSVFCFFFFCFFFFCFFFGCFKWRDQGESRQVGLVHLEDEVKLKSLLYFYIFVSCMYVCMYVLCIETVLCFFL